MSEKISTVIRIPKEAAIMLHAYCKETDRNISNGAGRIIKEYLEARAVWESTSPVPNTGFLVDYKSEGAR